MAKRSIGLSELRSAYLLYGNQRKAAKALGISQSTLSRTLKSGRVSSVIENRVRSVLAGKPRTRADVYAGADILKGNPKTQFKPSDKHQFKKTIKNYRKARTKEGFRFIGDQTSGRKLWTYGVFKRK